ncbi:hypothetical protein [Butyricicoccus sp.]|uniref:hypothetical protein n=1 Tax=Butyricicoccus sp. TaxID=2049021 RepID=UPI003D7C6654
MWQKEDTTYRDLRESSLDQWLTEMEAHEDLQVRGGVRLAREYLAYLKKENQRLQEQNQLTQTYLKKAILDKRKR